MAQKRIRFAPLPLSSSSSSSQLSSLGSSPIIPSPTSVNNVPASSFNRFFSSSSSSSSLTLTPTLSIESQTRSKDEIHTLAVVNTSSPESNPSPRNSSGWLTRWSSLGGSNPNLPIRSSPTQSKAASLFSTFSSSSSLSLPSLSNPKSKTKPTQAGHTNRHKGTRMLNGRVYGAQKNTNPFANARDEEPEFVEWGYGGMGSVKGANSAGVGTNWDRLRGGSAMPTRIPVAVGGVTAGMGATDVQLDDGSGLAWVKRRKQERESKAREQKEKEQKDPEKENSNNTPIPTRADALESNSAVVTLPTVLLPPSPVSLTPSVDPILILDQSRETATKPNFPTVTPSRHPSQLGVSPSSSLHPSSLTDDTIHNTHDNVRVLQAITVPLRAPRLHRQTSRGSREMLLSLATESPDTLPQASLIPSAGDDTTDTSTAALHTSTVTSVEVNEPSFSSPYSSSESGSESEVDDDGDDEEDEDESQKENESRETTLGAAAGVEKITRHKE